jgi:hypothetical protein
VAIAALRLVVGGGVLHVQEVVPPAPETVSASVSRSTPSKIRFAAPLPVIRPSPVLPMTNVMAPSFQVTVLVPPGWLTSGSGPLSESRLVITGPLKSSPSGRKKMFLNGEPSTMVSRPQSGRSK